MNLGLSLKRIFILSCFVVSSFGLLSQSINQLDPTISESSQIIKTVHHYPNVSQKSISLIWSEDFSNGIPSTWSNAGFDGNLVSRANTVWEYRGANTSPNNTVGSRGAFTTNQALSSASASNGFIIFDSDFLDNGGNASNLGGGFSPTPHVGTLTTSSINLSAHQDVVLKFTTYANVFFANFIVEFSADGGATWPNADTVHSNVILGVNAASPNGDSIVLNVSNYIGGSANAKIRFTFDGTPGNANGNGYYFWMIDDISLSSQPRHSLRFVDHNGAPKNDITFGNGQPSYGHLPLTESRPIQFDGNILNFGSEIQTNVRLKVDLLNGNGVVVQTLLSTSAIDTLLPGEVGTFNQLTTSPWNPNLKGNYQVVFSALSDSIPASIASSGIDTFDLFITDSIMSLDHNQFDNRFGTDDIGDNGSSVASLFTFQSDAYARSVDIFIDSTTVPGGMIEVTLFDSAGFSFSGGFGAPSLVYFQHTIDSNDVNSGVIRADLTNGTGIPIQLSTSLTNGYYVVVTLFSNNGINPIYIKNDQSLQQLTNASLMYYTISNPRWYTGFANSLSLNSPHIRLNSSSSCLTTQYLGTINTSCSSWTAPSGKVFTVSGTNLLDTVPPPMGSNCGTLYTFDLNLNFEVQVSDEFCGSYTLPSGRIVNTIGLHRDTIVSSLGCDSVLAFTLSLRILNEVQVFDVFCDSYTLPSGRIVNSFGLHYDTIPSLLGCDSIMAFTLSQRFLDTSVTHSSATLTVGETGASYQWYKCDFPDFGLINGATGQSYTATQNGSYFCIIEDDGCSDSSKCAVVDDVSLVEKAEATTFLVFPTPANESMLVLMKGLKQIASVKLLDIRGKTVLEIEEKGEQITIPTSDIIDGVYLLQVSFEGGGVEMTKVTIQH